MDGQAQTAKKRHHNGFRVRITVLPSGYSHTIRQPGKRRVRTDLIQVKPDRIRRGRILPSINEEDCMHTVIWTIRPNEGTSRRDIEDELENSKRDYSGGAGLKRVMLGVSSDNKAVVEISLWESKSAADAFFTKAWETGLSRRWQAAPSKREEWDTLSII
jgi:hypothetical protein